MTRRRADTNPQANTETLSQLISDGAVSDHVCTGSRAGRRVPLPWRLRAAFCGPRREWRESARIGVSVVGSYWCQTARCSLEERLICGGNSQHQTHIWKEKSETPEVSAFFSIAFSMRHMKKEGIPLINGDIKVWRLVECLGYSLFFLKNKNISGDFGLTEDALWPVAALQRWLPSALRPVCGAPSSPGGHWSYPGRCHVSLLWRCANPADKTAAGGENEKSDKINCGDWLRDQWALQSKPDFTTVLWLQRNCVLSWGFFLPELLLDAHIWGFSPSPGGLTRSDGPAPSFSDLLATAWFSAQSNYLSKKRRSSDHYGSFTESIPGF